MPVSGLVLTLCPDAEQQAQALSALRALPDLTLGTAQALRLPVVLESRSAEDVQTQLEALAALTGVEQVELAYLDFSDVETFALRPRRRKRELGELGKQDEQQDLGGS
jgi:nitrate reductase NapAB chaperone NapD